MGIFRFSTFASLVIVPLGVLFFLTSCSAQNELPKEVSVNSYESCAAQGYILLKSMPPKCITPAGVVFSKDAGVQSVCKDQCGNGICEEIVCLGSGCPCAESHATCPADCPA